MHFDLKLVKPKVLDFFRESILAALVWGNKWSVLVLKPFIGEKFKLNTLNNCDTHIML